MRTLLMLTVISLAGWCQPAQLQAQPQSAAKSEIPPADPWVRLVELAVPGLVGIAGALIGVLLTNRYNAATNEANRKHQLDVERVKAEIAAKYRSQDTQWAFRKDVYVNLITATSGLIRACSGVATNMSEANRLKHEQIPLTDLRMAGVIKRLNSDIDDYVAHGNVFATYFSLSPLAIAEDVVPLVKSTWERFRELDLSSPLSSPELIAANMPEQLKTLGELLRRLQVAGRKDLWGTPEPEAKAGATT